MRGERCQRLANVAVASLQVTAGHSSRSPSIVSPGTVTEVERWSAKFERANFGFTSLVETFDDKQEAMTAIPLDCL